MVITDKRDILSLLSTDIRKVKRLSLREAKRPAPEVRTERIIIVSPPLDEEIDYSRLIATNPIIEVLINKLDLVSSRTEERIRKVEIKDYTLLKRA